MQNITQLVKQSLAKTLNLTEYNNIKASDKLKDDLGLDSMSSLTFLMQLEETIHHFTVDPDTLRDIDLKTVASICSYVEREINKSAEMR